MPQPALGPDPTSSAFSRRASNSARPPPPMRTRRVGRLNVTNDLAAAVGDADFIIEAAPERIDLKLSCSETSIGWHPRRGGRDQYLGAQHH
jgi:hypothetical protein